MTDTAPPITIEDAKQRARAEIEQYRERRRVDREARDRANESAEAEIQRAILARREEEVRQEEVRAAHARFMEAHHAKVEAMRAAERAGRASGDFRLGPAAPPPARHVARLLRQRLGADFDSIVAQIRACDWRSFQNEIARVPADEAAERLYREREAQAAALAEAAKTLPEPEDAAEAEILSRYGFTPEKRAAELDAGAL
ncbi:hypothetical protein [Methylorubrum extorquens]